MGGPRGRSSGRPGRRCPNERDVNSNVARGFSRGLRCWVPPISPPPPPTSSPPRLLVPLFPGCGQLSVYPGIEGKADTAHANGAPPSFPSSPFPVTAPPPFASDAPPSRPAKSPSPVIPPPAPSSLSQVNKWPSTKERGKGKAMGNPPFRKSSA